MIVWPKEWRAWHWWCNYTTKAKAVAACKRRRARCRFEFRIGPPNLTAPAADKDVTRRLGWEYLKPGERLQVCRKVMGRKQVEPLERLAVIEVICVRREPLNHMLGIPEARGREYGFKEVIREGFPDYTPERFVDFFCATHKDCTPETLITRIEFKYVLNVMTLERVPMWGLAPLRGLAGPNVGHIVLSSDTRWTRTACGIYGTGFTLSPQLPGRICAKCRAQLPKLGQPQPTTEPLAESA